MYRLYYLFLISFLFSCNDSQIENKNNGSHTLPNNTNISINIPLKNALKGIWASDEYKQVLHSTNSITKAEKAVTFYTDIIFDGKKTMHGNKPSFMEEAYLYLKPDSTVVNRKGFLEFSILKIDKKTMQIKNSNGNVNSYKKVAEEADLQRMYLEITKGTSSIEQEWISGHYKIRLDTLDFEATLLKNGVIKSNTKFKNIYAYSYKDQDIMQFRLENDSMIDYTIKSYTDSIIILEGLQPIMELDEPLLPNGKTGYMKKI